MAIRAAAALAGGSLAKGHTAVRGGGGFREHEVTVVGAADQISHAVAVRVAVSAPQTTRLRRGTAGVGVGLSATILHSKHSTSKSQPTKYQTFGNWQSKRGFLLGTNFEIFPFSGNRQSYWLKERLLKQN